MAEFSWSLPDPTLPEAVTVPPAQPDQTQFELVFRRIFKTLLPSWLTTGEGELVLYSLGVIKDAFAERALQGLYARYPSYAPEDALPYIGRDRKIVRGIGEPVESYRARLLPWLDLHAVRGNPFSLMEQLAAYCQVNVRIRTVDRRGNWFTRDRDGTESWQLDTGNWNWDTVPASPDWSRFWVIIYPTLGGEPWQIMTGVVGDPDLWGSGLGSPNVTVGTTAKPEHVQNVKNIVREWQPDGTRCEWIIIAFDDASFDPASPEPDGTWGNWGTPSGGNLVRSRLSTARYWSGHS